MSTATIARRRLGQLETSALGLGCMGISFAYGPPAEESGTTSEAVDRALALADRGDLVLVTGSLYVVGAARTALG